MLKIHVWLPNSVHVGHTALSFGTDYVSFWPEDSAGKKDLKIKRSHNGAFVYDLADDIEAEGDRQPITIKITKYNTKKLKIFINKIQNNIPKYQLAKYNCSHVVAECLQSASDKQPSFIPNAASYGQLGKMLGKGIWTPDQVLRYAKEIASNIN